MIAEVEDDRQIKCWQKVGNIELKKKGCTIKIFGCWLFFLLSKRSEILQPYLSPVSLALALTRKVVTNHNMKLEKITT